MNNSSTNKNEENEGVAFQLETFKNAGLQQDFENIVELTSQICETPISLITIADFGFNDHYSIPFGIALNEIDNLQNLFIPLKLQKNGLVISDTTKDTWFQNSLVVTGKEAIRFFAAFPIMCENGFVIGSLSVMDRITKKLTSQQLFALKVLSQQISKLIQTNNYLLETKKNLEAAKSPVPFKESESLLVKIIDELAVGLLIQDARAKILLSNTAALDLLGLTEDQLLGKTSFDKYWKVIHEDGTDFPGNTHPVPAAIATKKPIVNVIMGVYRSANQDIIWLRVDAVPILSKYGEIDCVVCTLIDVTAQKIAEYALKSSEENLRSITEHTKTGYALIDKDLKLLFFNQSIQDFAAIQLQKKLRIGNYTLDIFQEDRREFLENTMRDVLTGKSISYEVSYPIPDNRLTWYYVKFFPVVNCENQVENIVMSIEDITSRKKTEAELSNSFEIATEQNKRLLNFSYIVTHNLRSHTSNIKSILHFLNTADSEAEKSELLKHLQMVSNSLENTMSNLNEVVSIQSNLNINVETIDLNDYIVKAIQLLNTQIEFKKVLVNNLVPVNTIFKYNPAYLESIVFNFISNAIKYSSPERIPEITIDTFYEEDKLVLRIADNGIGIDLKKNSDKLFGMYKTFNGNKDARGIGLFITKNQIDAMNGKIEVESEINVGTVFKIYLS